MRRGSLGWTAAALSGIAITAGVTWGASQLLAQPIGLASVPLSVVSSLAPAQAPPAAKPTVPVIAFVTPQPETSAAATHRRPHHTPAAHSTVTVTRTAPAATSPPAEPTVTPAQPRVPDVGQGSPAHAPSRAATDKPPNPRRSASTQTTTTASNTQTTHKQHGSSGDGGDDHGGGDGSDNERGDGGTTTTNTTTTGTRTSRGGGGGRDD